MAKRKRIEPAPPVATDPRARRLEQLARQEIARLKELDMDEGRRQSLSVSVMVSELDADVICTAKVRGGGRKGSEIARARRLKEKGSPDEIARAYADLELAHPEWPKGKLERAVAKNFGVSQSTVYRSRKRFVSPSC
jgi:hypothetical protein